MSPDPVDYHDLEYLVECGVFDVRKALLIAVNQRNGRAIKTLCEWFLCTKEHLCQPKNGATVLDEAFFFQDQPTILLLCDWFHITKDDIGKLTYSRSFDFMKFMVEHFGYHGSELDELLENAAKYGDLQLVQYLCVSKNRDLCGSDVLVDALNEASAEGHIDILRFLKSQYGLTTEDARANENCALKRAATNGHLGVVQFLHTDFGLSAEDVLDEYGSLTSALYWASKHLEILSYFFRDMLVPPDKVNVDAIVFQWPSFEWERIRKFLADHNCQAYKK